MALAIVLGLVFGFVATVPYHVGVKRSRNVTPESRFSATAILLLTLLASLVLLYLPVFICGLVARAMLLYFAIAMIGAFFVGLVVFGILNARRRKSK